MGGPSQPSRPQRPSLWPPPSGRAPHPSQQADLASRGQILLNPEFSEQVLTPLRGCQGLTALCGEEARPDFVPWSLVSRGKVLTSVSLGFALCAMGCWSLPLRGGRHMAGPEHVKPRVHGEHSKQHRV